LNLSSAEGISRPTSPTTHLHQINIPPIQIEKRKSLSRRVMESFCEHKAVYLDSDTGEQFVNKVVVDRYIKNHLNKNDDNNNNEKIYGNEKDPKIKLNRRTTSRQKVFCAAS
jgi:hypothetical protein